MYVDLTHTQKRYANYSLNVGIIIANRKQNVNLMQNFFRNDRSAVSPVTAKNQISPAAATQSLRLSVRNRVSGHIAAKSVIFVHAERIQHDDCGSAKCDDNSKNKTGNISSF